MQQSCACLVDSFCLIPDHEVGAAQHTNIWISGCWWRRDALSDEHLVGTKFVLLKCRSVRRKPTEQWNCRETGEARATKWNFDVELDTGCSSTAGRFQQYLHLRLRLIMTVKNPRCVDKECTEKHSGSELSGLTSAELLDALHAGLPVWRSHTFANAKRLKMLGRKVDEEQQRRTTTGPEFKFGGSRAEKIETYHRDRR